MQLHTYTNAHTYRDFDSRIDLFEILTFFFLRLFLPLPIIQVLDRRDLKGLHYPAQLYEQMFEGCYNKVKEKWVFVKDWTDHWFAKETINELLMKQNLEFDKSDDKVEDIQKYWDAEPLIDFFDPESFNDQVLNDPAKYRKDFNARLDGTAANKARSNDRITINIDVDDDNEGNIQQAARDDRARSRSHDAAAAAKSTATAAKSAATAARIATRAAESVTTKLNAKVSAKNIQLQRLLDEKAQIGTKLAMTDGNIKGNVRILENLKLAVNDPAHRATMLASNPRAFDPSPPIQTPASRASSDSEVKDSRKRSRSMFDQGSMDDSYNGDEGFDDHQTMEERLSERVNATSTVQTPATSTSTVQTPATSTTTDQTSAARRTVMGITAPSSNSTVLATVQQPSELMNFIKSQAARDERMQQQMAVRDEKFQNMMMLMMNRPVTPATVVPPSVMASVAAAAVAPSASSSSFTPAILVQSPADRDRILEQAVISTSQAFLDARVAITGVANSRDDVTAVRAENRVLLNTMMNTARPELTSEQILNALNVNSHRSGVAVGVTSMVNTMRDMMNNNNNNYRASMQSLNQSNNFGLNNFGLNNFGSNNFGGNNFGSNNYGGGMNNFGSNNYGGGINNHSLQLQRNPMLQTYQHAAAAAASQPPTVEQLLQAAVANVLRDNNLA